MSLHLSIEAVYDAFSDVPIPSAVDGCPCCMTPDEYELLTTKRLRELTSEELTEYASDVMLTMGSPEDYLYFFPRILELTIQDDVEWTAGAEIMAQKLRLAGYGGWDEMKQSSVVGVWRAIIRDIVEASTDPELLGLRASDVETWLAAATLVPIPVSPLLNELEEHADVIRTVYNYNFTSLFKDRLKNPFLEEPSPGQAEIARWLRDRVEQTIK